MSEWSVPGYTELKPLGSGGFGSVVLARHDATGTPVAVKYLLPALGQDPGFAAMFRAEAEALGALDDPHVVRLYEYVESAAGAAIVMELIDGVTLSDILLRHGSTTPEAALVILYGSLLGLAAAHARGVVHRDFKPANVYLYNGDLAPNGKNDPDALLRLDAAGAASAPQRVSANSYKMTLTYTTEVGFYILGATYTYCVKPTEAQDGTGLPGPTACGAATIPATDFYDVAGY